MTRFSDPAVCVAGQRDLAGGRSIAIGSRRELFVDDALVERLAGKADLRLHQPTPQNVAVTTDEPWEGNGTNYVTVFQDGDKYRMYYRGSHYSYLDGKDRPNTRDLYCYAESSNGIHWTKPELGTLRLERLEAEQHRLGRCGRSWVRAVPRHESELPTGGRVQGAGSGW